jgi:hypothetical protein
MELYESTGSDENMDFKATMGDSDTLDYANYRPGVLTEMEDNLNAARDKVFEDEFFCGC